MKLTLESRVHKKPVFFWIVLLLSCVGVMIWQMPASWLSSALSSQMGCRVMLHQASGTIWQGSAALAFSEANAAQGGCRDPIAVTERFQWATSCKPMDLSCKTSLQFVAFNQPQNLLLTRGGLEWSANEVKLPANVLAALGNPWSTLRPRGELDARWTDLKLAWGSAASTADGVIRIIISNLSSPISPVKPLGSYEIAANLGGEGVNWTLSTTAGPLLLRGQGSVGGQSGQVQFSGEASAAPESQDSLIGLLSLLGKQEANVYRLKF